MLDRVRCPACRKKFEKALIKPRFKCFHCKEALSFDEKNRPLKEGLGLFSVAMGAWFFWRWRLHAAMLDGAFVMAFIGAFYLGHLWTHFRTVDSLAVEPSSIDESTDRTNPG